MVLFSDLTKTQSDFFQKHFAHNTLWEVKAKGLRDRLLFSNTSTCTGNAVKSSTSVKATHDLGSVDLKYTGDGSCTADFRGKMPKQVPGLTLISTVEKKSQGKGESIEIGAEYEKCGIHSNILLNPFSKNIYYSLLYQNKNLKTGAAISTNLSNIYNVDYQFGCSYIYKDIITSIKTYTLQSNPIGKILCNIYMNNNNIEYGGELLYNSKSNTSTFSYCMKYFLDDITFIKGKINHDSKLLLSVSSKINKLFSVTVSSQIDVLNSSNDIKSGVLIEFDT
eukprot:GHVL01024716.1.p1 GENE.GHVL01024716.1~~GHVL01024716.1.p1  ORF type:complete len:279 (+),score=74.87 GHVL01024716.1:26-862(+)